MPQNTEVSTIDNTIQVTLHPQPLGKGPLSILLLLVGFNFTIPIVGVVFIVFMGGLELGFGTFIGVALFWGIAIYFMRKLLWGTFGKEVIRITDNEIHHYFDYYLYKDGGSRIKYHEVQIGYLMTKDNPEILWITKSQLPNDTHCWLAIVVAHETFIISHETLSISDVKKIDGLLRKND